MIRRVGVEAETGCRVDVRSAPPDVRSSSNVVSMNRVGRGRCVAAQKLLAQQGFPCPMPMTDAIVSDGIAVHAERFVGGGELETEDTPEAAARSARLLADLVRRMANLDVEPPLGQIRSGCDGTRCPSTRWPRRCPPGSKTLPGACRQSWPDATSRPCSVTPTGKRRRCAGGTERRTSSTTGTASPGCPRRGSPEAPPGIFASHGKTTLAPLTSPRGLRKRTRRPLLA